MNPLKKDDLAETCAAVRHTLFFMADAFRAMASSSSVESSESSSLGAALIMEVCADALRDGAEGES